MSTTTWDEQGRIVSAQSTGRVATTLSYDEAGRLEEVAQGAERPTTSTYHSISGYLASQTNALDEVTSYETDTLGRAQSVEAPDGSETLFGYDEESRLTSVTPADRSEHELSYTPVDLSDDYIAPQIGAEPTLMSRDYDLDRALTGVTQPDGSELVYTYAPTTGLLATSTIPGAGTYTYGYDAQARLSTIATTGGHGTTTYGYDGSLVTSLATAGPQSIAGVWTGTLAGSAVTTYSPAFLPATIEPRGASGQPNGFAARYHRDNDDLVTSIAPVTGTAVPTLTLVRSPLDGHVVSTAIGTSPTTVSTAYDVDVDATMLGSGDLLGFSANVGSTEVYGVSYARDALGRITRLDETIESTTLTRKYEYDGAGRLIRVRDDADAIVSEYEYDGNGARMRALTPSGDVELGTDLGCGAQLDTPVDAQDRLCRYGDFEYAYDDNGRLSTKTQLSTSAETAYTYDGLGRLRRVALPNGTQLDYVHDALGRRIGKVVDGVLERGWLYGENSLRPLAELDGSGQIAATFVYESRVNVPDLIVAGTNGTGEVYRVITDHLGSVRLMVNVGTGAVAQRMDYDEFGNVLNDTNPGFQPFGFAGGLYDAETGLVRFGVRDYDAVTGRWTAKDPILFDGGQDNLYEYSGSDPANQQDANGKQVGGTAAPALPQCAPPLPHYWLIGAAVAAGAALMCYASGECKPNDDTDDDDECEKHLKACLGTSLANIHSSGTFGWSQCAACHQLCVGTGYWPSATKNRRSCNYNWAT